MIYFELMDQKESVAKSVEIRRLNRKKIEVNGRSIMNGHALHPIFYHLFRSVKKKQNIPKYAT